MKQFLLRFGGFALVVALLAWWMAEPKVPPAPAGAAPTKVAIADLPPPTPESEAKRIRAEQAARESAVAAGMIAEKERDLANRAKAEARGKIERAVVGQRHGNAYAEFISTNTPTYLALVNRARAVAAQLGGEVRCTICSGDHYLRFCLLCRELHGKCRNCEGTGRIFITEYCPWCIGSGKCFLCAGYGKMLCPFCDDGVIDPARPVPSNELLVE